MSGARRRSSRSVRRRSGSSLKNATASCRDPTAATSVDGAGVARAGAAVGEEGSTMRAWRDRLSRRATECPAGQQGAHHAGHPRSRALGTCLEGHTEATGGAMPRPRRGRLRPHRSRPLLGRRRTGRAVRLCQRAGRALLRFRPPVVGRQRPSPRVMEGGVRRAAGFLDHSSTPNWPVLACPPMPTH